MVETHTVSRDDEITERAPDIALTDSGVLVCVFHQSVHHGVGSAGHCRIMATRSLDRGRSWRPKRPLTPSDDDRPDPGYHAPRVVSLGGDRLVAVTANSREQTDPDGEFQATTAVQLRESDDAGESWNEPREPPTESVMESCAVPELEVLSGTHDGRWILSGSGRRRGDDTWVVHAITSDDAGETWNGPTTIAADPDLELTEPSIVELPGGELVCFMREDSRQGMDAYKAISEDGGDSWEGPYRMPLPGVHRPVAGMLNSGTVLITYRFHQGGRLATGAQNTFGALTDVESCLAREREGAHTEIMPIDHDSSYCPDTGYTGWVQFDDATYWSREDEIYVVNYIKDDAPHLQVRDPEDYDGRLADAPKAHIRGYSLHEHEFINRPYEYHKKYPVGQSDLEMLREEEDDYQEDVDPSEFLGGGVDG